MKKFIVCLISFLLLFGTTTAFAATYWEDFEDGEIDDTVWRVHGDYLIEDGKMYMSEGIPDSVHVNSVVGIWDSECFMYHIEADIFIVPDTIDQFVGLELDWIELPSGDVWAVNVASDPAESKFLVAFNTPDGDYYVYLEQVNPRQTYSLSITLQDDYVTIGINGTKTDLFPGAFRKPASFEDHGAYVHGWAVRPLDVDYGIDNIKIYSDCEESVQIDIKPGSYPNCFNNNGHGVIPVAILSDCVDGFDATEVDASTVTLAGMEIKAVGKSNKSLAHIEDVNGDGCDDLTVQIEDQDGAFTVGTGTATLVGELYDGTLFSGTDDICIVPEDSGQSAMETDCIDGIDNDGDSLTDCEDPDCEDYPVCSWPPEVVPTEGPVGSDFTITDHHGRLRPGDIVLFYPQGDNPENGIEAENVDVPAPTSLTGKVPQSLISGVMYYMTVRPSRYEPSRFDDLPFLVT